VEGRLGLAMADADIENRTLVALVGEVLRAARLPADLGGSGRSHLRCFALRLNAAGGNAAIGALVLDSARLLMQGSGTIALADGGLGLRLRPVVRLGSGSGVAVPVRVGGTLREPKAALDVGGSLLAALASAGLQGGRGVSPSGIDRNGELCPPALAAARNGGPGPATPAAAPAAGAGAPGAGASGRISPSGLLRDLSR